MKVTEPMTPHGGRIEKLMMEESSPSVGYVKMAEGVLVDVAGSLVEMLLSAAFEEIGLLYGVKGEFRKLVDTTEVVKGVLLDAEEKMAVDESVKAWLKQLGDAFFVADDLVDKFHNKLLQRRVMSGNEFKMGQQIKDIREKVDHIRVNRSFHLDVRRPIETTVASRNMHDDPFTECKNRVF
ncbi:hypothetical protein F8388_021024 [Cannabis sativa]|uniref:Disease resistance N-terminal domain-containing protein n=2 Tax=Cannabis sativa TaxID=3483 RepID=A0A7J6DTL0_CANSA|nr:hypothetical protein F8388_021024 [Cannabis sativa]